MTTQSPPSGLLQGDITIAIRLRKAAAEIELAYGVHSTQRRGPREMLLLPQLSGTLRKVADAIRAGNFEQAVRIYSDFSVVRHAQWLSSRRKKSQAASLPVIPAKVIPPGFGPVDKKECSARANGRSRMSPRGWAPRVIAMDIAGKNYWHMTQAAMLLSDISRELTVGQGASPSRRNLIEHKLSIRLEREVAKALQLPQYAHLKAHLPPRWQPLSPYSNTPGAVRALRLRVIREIRKTIEPGIAFYIQIDRGCGCPLREMGPFVHPRDIQELPSLIRDALMNVRPSGTRVWKSVDLPLFIPRPRAVNDDREYDDLCEKYGKQSADAAYYAWIAWGVRPSRRGLVNLIIRYGREDPLIEAILSSRGLRGKQVHMGIDSLSSERAIDHRPKSDFRGMLE